MYLRREALISSQIEGTQCTMDDLLDPDVDENTNMDVQDVIHLLQALNYAITRRKDIPLCNRLLLEIHSVLLSEGRGSERQPGEFRRSQNWIGGNGCALKDARYIPPNVDDMTQAISDLEKFIHSDVPMDPLISAALIHYQFETIHPFLDGNGRIGRLLILLFLMERGILSKPVLYISYFLKKNQIEYYDRMTLVRTSGNYEQWVKFFLEAIVAAATDASDTAIALIRLHEENTARLAQKPKLQSLLAYLEQHPIIDIPHTADALSLSFSTTATRLQQLEELGIVCQGNAKARNRRFHYEQYLDILRR